MDLLIYGVINSVILVLYAIGFSLTFGIAGIANFAYGGLYVLSGIIAWGFIAKLSLPFPLAMMLAVVITGLIGYLIYWGLISRVRGMVLSEVIVTFAAGVAIIEILRWRGFIGMHYALPVFVHGGMTIGGISVNYQRLFIIGIGIALIISLYLFTHYARIGRSFRGIAQTEFTAISLGISSDRTAALSLAFGSALGAVAAMLVLPLGIISITQGYDVLLLALSVGIVGGLESTLGIIVASFILGFSQIIMAKYFAPEWMIVVVLAAIFIILVIKPSGIFGKFKELEEKV